MYKDLNVKYSGLYYFVNKDFTDNDCFSLSIVLDFSRNPQEISNEIMSRITNQINELIEKEVKQYREK